MSDDTPRVGELVIEASHRNRINWRELAEYRDLLYFLVWRSIRVRYAQSALGVGWAIIQPVFTMLVFNVIFGSLMNVESDGAPYAIFSFVALVPWTYFSNALTGATESLVTEANMISKIYFPRMILPLTAVLARLVDFAIAMVLLAGLLVWYQTVPNIGVLMLPVLIAMMMATAAGMGMWLTAMAVQYRDIKHAMSFGVQLLMYLAPVVYPVSVIPEQYQLVYALNPMVGVIEGFRSAFLGSVEMPWDLMAIGAGSAFVLLASGAWYFRKTERIFADVA